MSDQRITITVRPPLLPVANMLSGGSVTGNAPCRRDHFDYGAVAPDLAAKLRKQAEHIRARIASHTRAIIDTGRDLIAVKDHLDHGQFSEWVEKELLISTRTAQAYMRAARFAEDEGKTAIIALLPPTTLHRLAAKSTPPEIKIEVLRRVEAGEVVSDKEVADRILYARGEQRLALREAAAKTRRKKSKRWREQREAAQREREEERRRDEEVVRAALAMLVRKLEGDELQLLQKALITFDLGPLLEGHLRETSGVAR